MAEGEAMTREGLFREVCECWQRTEDAIAALGKHFETQANDGWTVGDTFRHLTAASHIMSGRIRALLATGELPFPGDDGNAAGVAKFASLDYKMLRGELDRAHGAAWIYLRQFSDEDLAQTFTIFDKEYTLGEVIRQRVLHEAGHVNEAREAAGKLAWELWPLARSHVRGNRRWNVRFALREKEGNEQSRHPDFEMLANGKSFGTLAYVSGNWILDRAGVPLKTYSSRAQAWQAAQSDYPLCASCGGRDTRRPRSDGNRPATICRSCYGVTWRRRRAYRERSLYGELDEARNGAREHTSAAAQAALYAAIEAAEAAVDFDALDSLGLARPHIEAATALPHPYEREEDLEA